LSGGQVSPRSPYCKSVPSFARPAADATPDTDQAEDAEATQPVGSQRPQRSPEWRRRRNIRGHARRRRKRQAKRAAAAASQRAVLAMLRRQLCQADQRRRATALEPGRLSHRMAASRPPRRLRQSDRGPTMWTPLWHLYAGQVPQPAPLPLLLWIHLAQPSCALLPPLRLQPRGTLLPPLTHRGAGVGPRRSGPGPDPASSAFLL
jgi:hypothetical protein